MSNKDDDFGFVNEARLELQLQIAPRDLPRSLSSTPSLLSSDCAVFYSGISELNREYRREEDRDDPYSADSCIRH